MKTSAAFYLLRNRDCATIQPGPEDFRDLAVASRWIGTSAGRTKCEITVCARRRIPQRATEKTFAPPRYLLNSQDFHRARAWHRHVALGLSHFAGVPPRQPKVAGTGLGRLVGQLPASLTTRTQRAVSQAGPPVRQVLSSMPGQNGQANNQQNEQSKYGQRDNAGPPTPANVGGPPARIERVPSDLD